MSAANTEPDIAIAATTDRTTLFMETPLFRPATLRVKFPSGLQIDKRKWRAIAA
jgi:hypothetical protein